MKRILFLVLFLSLGCQKNSGTIESLVDARFSQVPAPRPSTVEKELDWARAYDLQDHLIKRIASSQGELVGYTLSPGSGIDPQTGEKVPVYGQLFESMLLAPNATVKRSDFVDLHLENEVAFIIGDDIPSDQIGTRSDLKPYIREVAPAVELPDVRFAGPLSDVTGLDLVVDNVAASRVILGKGQPLSKVNVDAVAVKMVRDGKKVNGAVATMVAGSPWNTLFWLVKELEKKNRSLKAGQVVITGAMGKFMDGDSGRYTATFTQLGEITFRVNP